MNRDFTKWLRTFKSSICNYSYYVNFDRAYKNVDSIKVELNILNSLIGSQNIENDFLELVRNYPQVLKCIPILLAVRGREISVTDETGDHTFGFSNLSNTAQEYATFLRNTGLFDLISSRIVGNLYDYVTGVEVGLDSNGRKSRGGDLMEDLVESYLIKANLQKGVDYFKEMYLSDIEKTWNLDLSALSNNGTTKKRFDFVISTKSCVYAIETNFYATQGSKLNETARSYKTLALESKRIDGFAFVWITDGYNGWKAARHNLEETFAVMDNLYCISDLENGVLNNLIK